MEHRRVCFCMLSLLPLVQISELSQANSLLFGKVCCRTPRGVRGLKYGYSLQAQEDERRTPRGVRGLKFDVTQSSMYFDVVSHPSRGAWIEINAPANLGIGAKSHPSRGAWIEIDFEQMEEHITESHPSRGAWIEIFYCWV